MGVDGSVGGARFEWGWLDQADRGPLGKAFGSDVGPGFAIVAGELDEAVVGADPDQALLLRRFRDGENQIVKLDAGLVLGDGAAGILLLGFVVAGEVGADGLPGMAAVVRTEKELRRMIKNAGIVTGKHDGHGPSVTVFLDGSVFAVGIERPLLNVLHLIGAAVEARDVTKVRAGINDV